MTPVVADSNKAVSRPRIAIKRPGSPADIRLKCSSTGQSAGRATGTLADPFGKVVDIRRGAVLDNVALPIGGVIESEKQNRSLGRGLRRLLLLASGQTVASIIALMAFWASLRLNDISGLGILQPMAALTLIRVWYFHTRGPEPVLNLYKIRKRAWRTMVDEGKISIVFFGVCFVMPWSLTVQAALVFVAVNFAIQLCLMSVSRLVIKVLAGYNKTVGRTDAMAQRALVVGTGKNARAVADMISSSPELDTRLVGFLDFHRQGYWRYRDIPLIGHPDTLGNIVANSQVDALFWAVEPEDIPGSWKLMETAERMGVRIFVMPNLYSPKIARMRPTYINGLPAMVYRSEPESPVPLLLKSLMDRIGAGIGLLLTAPLMLLVAAIVKLDSRGPVFFNQTRLGLNGKPFTLFKFRTMCSDAETRKGTLLGKNEMSGPVFKIKKDPRVTKVGGFLRKFSVDELPQLFNILRGEMSLVGPRPPLPQEVSRFEPWQHRKLSVRPGLTCLWQVNGRNDIDFEEWMQLDLQYIDNWSLWLDAKILAKTIPAVVRGSGR